MLIFVFIVLFSFRIYNLSSGVGLLVLVSTYLYIFETAVPHKSPEKPSQLLSAISKIRKRTFWKDRDTEFEDIDDFGREWTTLVNQLGSKKVT